MKRPQRIILTREQRRLNVLQLIMACMGVAMLLVITLLMLLLLTGCSPDGGLATDGPATAAGTRGSAIAFAITAGDSTAPEDTRGDTEGSGTSVPSTRTAPGTLTLSGGGDGERSLREAGFGVFACHTGVHPYVSMSTHSNLMWNQPVAWGSREGAWTYSPVVYWPNGDEGADELVTFFAYAPFSDPATGEGATQCITDHSRADESGDPWIVYRLGGTEEAGGAGGWKQQQADLLYDFRKDLRREAGASTQVDFSFKHALACVGDRITVTCGEALLQRLMSMYDDRTVTLTMTSLTLDYVLTRKGRLVLNSVGQPNWQAVESEDAKVHRYLRLLPNQVMARATSLTDCAATDYATTGHGVFYIPIEVGDEGQRVEVSVGYVISNGESGVATTTVDLSRLSEASSGRDLSITLSVPEPPCGGEPLTDAAVGMLICSHGRVHPATGLLCSGRKVAMVAYVGEGDTSGDHPYSHGLAVALRDAGSGVWCSQQSSGCLGLQVTDTSAALGLLNGLGATATLLEGHDGHDHAAATLAATYQYANIATAGAHPAGTSQWFLPSVGQWNLMVKAMTGLDADLENGSNDAYKATAFAALLEAAGADGFRGGTNQKYWSSTESSDSHAWYMSFEKGKTSKDEKRGEDSNTYFVRPVLAF